MSDEKKEPLRLTGVDFVDSQHSFGYIMVGRDEESNTSYILTESGFKEVPVFSSVSVEGTILFDELIVEKMYDKHRPAPKVLDDTEAKNAHLKDMRDMAFRLAESSWNGKTRRSAIEIIPRPEGPT